jgi:CelD/BcsL family acetyltransferase involved in cellulose biosynthesis
VSLAPRVYESPEGLGALREKWDELAVAVGRPFSAPAWGLAWWQSLRPEKAQLRLVVVEDGARLVGVVPLYATGRSLLPLGDGLAPVEPLAEPGFEAEVSRAAAVALAELAPRPATVELEVHGSSPDWSAMLDEAWAGGRGGWRWNRSDAPVPRVVLGEGYDSWMEGRSATFRKEMRKKQRKLDSVGGTFRYATEATLERDVQVFVELHRLRLSGKGGTSLPQGMERMLTQVGLDLLASGRFRLLCLELDGKSIAAQLLLVAGEEVSAWNTGFDEAHAKLSPLMLCMIHSLADAAGRDERTMSFGPGAQQYKYRLANDEDSLRKAIFVPYGSGYAAARLRLLPQQVRRGLGARLSPGAKQRIRRLGRPARMPRRKQKETRTNR